jgi:uncharacterized protein (DUF3820 family)
MKMPFGKYKGDDIHRLPRGYLLWMRDNIAELQGDLLEAVRMGLEGKEYLVPTEEVRIDRAVLRMRKTLESQVEQDRTSNETWSEPISQASGES